MERLGRPPRIGLDRLSSPLAREPRCRLDEGARDAMSAHIGPDKEATDAVGRGVVAQIDASINGQRSKLRDRAAWRELHPSDHGAIIVDGDQSTRGEIACTNGGLELGGVLLGAVGAAVEPLVLRATEVPVPAET